LLDTFENRSRKSQSEVVAGKAEEAEQLNRESRPDGALQNECGSLQRFSSPIKTHTAKI
jgi:hypothetical protein